jgi:exodeoxyribonuclease III
VSLRLLSYNIRYGGNGRESALVQVVEHAAPDVVVLQEATDPAVVERLARDVGMTTWAARPGWSVAFLSRTAVSRYEWRKPRWSRRAFLEIVPADGLPSIFGVHLSAVHSNWTERRRTIELRSLLTYIRSRESGFHVVVGDFNTLAPGETLDMARLPRRLRAIAWLTGRRIRWRTIQLMLEADYVDGYRLRHPEDGYTFPTWDPHLRLDYAFVPLPFAPRVTACEVVTHPLARGASDHLPLLVELDIEAEQPRISGDANGDAGRTFGQEGSVQSPPTAGS